MTIIVPTITASEPHEYREQIERVKGFAKRVHIDLMDGEFAPTHSPSLEQIWWPHELEADIHLMYQRPMEHLEQLIKLKPRLVVVHNEAELHHMHFCAELHKHGIKVGLALLQDTPVEYAEQIMHSFDHVLVFSGHLGYHGGKADLHMLDKVRKIQAHHPEVEVGWDGGINKDNIRFLIAAGVEVLNVGGFIQKSAKPKASYDTLEALARSGRHV
jgi:ribulose-phosphate 3-epimerase